MPEVLQMRSVMVAMIVLGLKCLHSLVHWYILTDMLVLSSEMVHRRSADRKLMEAGNLASKPSSETSCINVYAL